MSDGELGFLGEQGNRRAMAIGAMAGFMGPVLNRWEPVLVVAGVALGESSQSGGTPAPVGTVEDAPMMALLGLLLGAMVGFGVKYAQDNGYI